MNSKQTTVDESVPSGGAGHRRPHGRGDPRVNRIVRDALRRFGFLLRRTVSGYFTDKVSRLGAALAYYTTLSVTPLMVLAIALAGLIFDEGTARQRVLGEIEQLAGSHVTEAVGSVEHPAAAPVNTWTTAIGLVMLVVGASKVFLHLQDGLNSIWRVENRVGERWRTRLRRRMFSFATVVMTGFLLLVSLIASAALSWVGDRAGQILGAPEAILQAVNFVLSFSLTTVLFATIFKVLPDIPIRWANVWMGAMVSTGLFTIGKTALGIYFAKTDVTSAYGVAGSVIVLLIWSYYAAQIVFIGAQFTRIHTLTEGGRNRQALSPKSPARSPVLPRRNPRRATTVATCTNRLLN